MNAKRLAAMAVGPVALAAIVAIALQFVPEWVIHATYWTCASVALVALYVKSKRTAAARAALLVADRKAGV